MSLLQDYERAKAEIGAKKYNAIDVYIEEICPTERRNLYKQELKKIDDLEMNEWEKEKKKLEQKYGIVYLDDILYNEKGWQKFEEWYRKYSNRKSIMKEVRNDIEKEVKKILKDRTNKEFLSKKYNFNNVYPVCYLINTSNQKDSFAICLDEKQEDALLLNPYTKNEQLKFQIVDYYNFNFDDHFFRYVQNGYEIGKVNMQAHYAMWTQVGEWYPKDIRYKDGMQRYLKYCKDNNISKEKIDRVCGTKMTADIMKYYKEKKVLEIKRVGIDDGDRPVYKDKNGNLYKDVSLGTDSSMSSLCTAVNNEFYGEPECPLKKDIEIKVVNRFVENIKKDKER